MGRAIEQAEAERVLQLLHVLADDRRRRAQVGGGFREAPAFRHPHESVELVQVSQRCRQRHLMPFPAVRGLCIMRVLGNR